MSDGDDAGEKPSVPAEATREGSVIVTARFRPLSEAERSNGGNWIVSTDVKSCAVRSRSASFGHQFTFDAVLDADVTQQAVFQRTALPVVNSVIDGYNGTILAYGQTGSGKTFTMEGPDVESGPELRGITSRAVDCLFDGVRAAPEGDEFVLKLSILEIYLERIRDLLPFDAEAPTAAGGLQIKEKGNGAGIHVPELAEHFVRSEEEARAKVQMPMPLECQCRLKWPRSRSLSSFVALPSAHQATAPVPEAKRCLTAVAHTNVTHSNATHQRDSHSHSSKLP